MAKVKRENPTTHQAEVIEVPQDQILPGDEIIQEQTEQIKPWEDVSTETIPQSVSVETVKQPVETVIEAVGSVVKSEVDKTVPEAIKPLADEAVEMVVVYAKSRFGITKQEGGVIHVEAGESVVPKWIAEHFYAKAQGIRVIGKVEDNSISSALSQRKIELIEKSLADLAPTTASMDGITDLSEEQKEHLTDLFSFVNSSVETFAKFKSTFAKGNT